jgi:hypothetical protein
LPAPSGVSLSICTNARRANRIRALADNWRESGCFHRRPGLLSAYAAIALGACSALCLMKPRLGLYTIIDVLLGLGSLLVEPIWLILLMLLPATWIALWLLD